MRSEELSQIMSNTRRMGPMGPWWTVNPDYPQFGPPKMSREKSRGARIGGTETHFLQHLVPLIGPHFLMTKNSNVSFDGKFLE